MCAEKYTHWADSSAHVHANVDRFLCAVQMTSLFMHASPALVVWALRWTPEPSVFDASTLAPAEAAKFSHATFGELVGGAMALHLVWATIYYLKVRTPNVLNA